MHPTRFNALMRLPQVIEVTGLSRSTLYERVRAGLFPPPIKMGSRTSVWPFNDVQAYNKAVVAGASPSDLREMVCGLVRARVRPAGSQP